MFSRLKYPKHLVNSTIKSFVDSKVCDQQQPLSPSQEKDDTIRVVLQFKDQISADIVKKQLKDLSLKVHTTIQPVFVSRKIEQELNVKETKPPIVNQQCVVYGFQCDLCDAGYVGYTRGHIFFFFLKALLLRYHFIKNALPVSRFHNQSFKETIQLLRYIYIYEI